MRQKIVAGNWKMHGSLSANAALMGELASAVSRSSGSECVVCVPAPYLAQAQSTLAGTAIRWGAQNVSEHPQGAFTGEVSVGMLRDFACSYAIVGHSERRSLYGESDGVVAEKVAAVLGGGITPILCVGESLAERESDRTHEVVARQLDAVISRVGIAAFAALVIAYEPVWAIGTGRTATPAQAQEVHAAIRARLAVLDPAVAAGARILYGGSVKASNAAEIFAMPDVDGGLIGGASLVAGDFLAICAAAR